MSRAPLPLLLFALAACGSDSIHLGGERKVSAEADGGADAGDGDHNNGGPGGGNGDGRNGDGHNGPGNDCSPRDYDDVCGWKNGRPEWYECREELEQDGAEPDWGDRCPPHP